MKTLGQIAYEAYCEFSGGASLVSREILQNWHQLTPEVRLAWDTAGAAAVVYAAPFEGTSKIDRASVKVMRSHDYCHFEIVLGTDATSIPSQVDALRKEAARLADKAVAQYKIAKLNAEKILKDVQNRQYLIDRVQRTEAMPEGERTVSQQAELKAYKDGEYSKRRQYDYQDDWDENE